MQALIKKRAMLAEVTLLVYFIIIPAIIYSGNPPAYAWLAFLPAMVYGLGYILLINI